MIYKYYGPPGTGKTFKLISRAKAYARLGTPLHKIGYFAFSKKAAGVAKERMPANDKNLPYFQTLHSFCFTFLDINMEDIMQPYHYEKFGKEINVKVKYADKYNKEEINYLTCDNPYFQIIHKAVNKCISVREEYELWEHNPKEILWGTLKYISDSLGTEAEMKVHKFAEEAMYKHIAYAIISNRFGFPEYVVQRLRKEKIAATRKAKLRLSNIKLEEITQILRGSSKHIKH